MRRVVVTAMKVGDRNAGPRWYNKDMDNTIRRMAKVLGACAVEASGHDARLEVVNSSGERLRVSLAGETQRLMAVLQDPGGQTRCTVDLAPVAHVTEDPHAPGRTTVHIGRMQVHIDSQPSLSIEIVSEDFTETYAADHNYA
jgi:hypothetical protein